MTPHDHDLEREHERRIAYLMGVLDPMMRELDRIYAPGRFVLLTMLEHRKGRRLLYRADAILAEIAGLRGTEHRSLPPLRHRNPTLPGHPLGWLALQYVVGISNASQMVVALREGHYWLAACTVVGMVLCTQWRLPPWRLARQGKYNDD